MVLLTRNTPLEETMPQTVPSAGFTPPCDYSNFAEHFDLSLLPPPPPADHKPLNPKIYTTFYPSDSPPDFQTLLVPEDAKLDIFVQNPQSPLSPYSPLLLSPNTDFGGYRQSSEANFYPSSPELSLYTPSPAHSAYSQSPCGDEYLQTAYVSKIQPSSLSPRYSPYHHRSIKEENFLGFSSSPNSPAASCYSSGLSSPEQIATTTTTTSDVLDLLENTVLLDIRRIKQEEPTVDFGSILDFEEDSDHDDRTDGNLKRLLEEDFKPPASRSPTPKDHQLLREVLRDTSFQKKFNIKPIDFGFITQQQQQHHQIKMEEPDEHQGHHQSEMQMQENIGPVLNLAIEQMRKDVDNTCKALAISPDPTQWTSANVLSWLQWTSRQFSLSDPVADQWDMSGASLAVLSEEDFTRRSPQGGMILHAQLEIWKAAYSEDEMGMSWLPETASSNASSGDVSDDDDEEASSSQTSDPVRPTTSTAARSGGSHIHLWQFLKELLASPQVYGSCIRWLDRTKGIFKIEDSVKVARLWGKRKNRPAMNYDKLSRSIRQYYKKGIMKKTERSQRLVYQFCHPYNL